MRVLKRLALLQKCVSLVARLLVSVRPPRSTIFDLSILVIDRERCCEFLSTHNVVKPTVHCLHVRRTLVLIDGIGSVVIDGPPSILFWTQGKSFFLGGGEWGGRQRSLVEGLIWLIGLTFSPTFPPYFKALLLNFPFFSIYL